MLTDPEQVAVAARRMEAENWKFRTYVKMLRRPSLARVDGLAEQFGRAAEARMDCTTCGACCRDNWIELDAVEVDRLAAHLGIDVEVFRGRYVQLDDDGQPGLDARPCPFLEGNRCGVYPVRPDACRGYPYVGGPIAPRMIGIIERAATCPIVFEMLEQLKDATHFNRLK